MFHVRKTKTASGATAIQVVRYQYRKTQVCAHIGSAHDPQDLLLPTKEANRWIKKTTGQTDLFPSFPPQQKELKETVLVIGKSQYLGVRYNFLYEVLSRQLRSFSFHAFDTPLLFDLVLMRIVEPASKLASLKLLSSLFGIKYQRGHLYETLAAYPTIKERIELAVLELAKKHFQFDFSIVFYDVTTLYGESFAEDEDTLDQSGNLIAKGFRRKGFSKDNKSNQPQVIIGLIVTQEGFPVGYEVFEGDKFEGDTFIPAVVGFQKKYRIDTLTVVADAAMISLDNVEKLKSQQLSYICRRPAGQPEIQPDQSHYPSSGWKCPG